MDDKTVYKGTGVGGMWWRKFAKLTVVIPVIAVLFVVAGVIVFLNTRSANKQSESAYDSAIEAADAAWATGDYEESLASLEKVVGDAKTDEQKVELYSSLSAAAASTGDLAKALDYLEKKHDVDPDTADDDAYIEGSYYERLGNYDKAIEKYRQALEYAKKSEESTQRNSMISSLEQRISDLEAQE